MSNSEKRSMVTEKTFNGDGPTNLRTGWLLEMPSVLLNASKKKFELGHFCLQGRFEFEWIFMRHSNVIGGIPGVPSNFYPSLERLLFKVVFSLHEKKGEVFVDTV